MSVTITTGIVPLTTKSTQDSPFSTYENTMQGNAIFETKKTAQKSNRKELTVPSALPNNDDRIETDNSFGIEGWNKKPRHTSVQKANEQQENSLMSSQESLFEAEGQNIFKNDLANLSNGLFTMHIKDIERNKVTKPLGKITSGQYFRPGYIPYSKKFSSVRRMKQEQGNEINIVVNGENENKYHDGRLEKVKESNEEEKSKRILEKDEPSFRSQGKGMPLFIRKNSQIQDDRKEKSTDQGRCTLGGGFVGLNKLHNYIISSRQNQEPPNSKLYLKVMQLLDKSSTNDEKTTTAVAAKAALSDTISNGCIAFTSPSKPEKIKKSDRKLARYLTPSKESRNNSELIIHQEHNDFRKTRFNKDWSSRKDLSEEIKNANMQKDFGKSVTFYATSRKAKIFPAFDNGKRRQITPFQISKTASRIVNTNKSEDTAKHNASEIIIPSPFYLGVQSSAKKGNTRENTENHPVTQKEKHASYKYHGRSSKLLNRIASKTHGDSFLPYNQQEQSFELTKEGEGQDNSPIPRHMRTTSLVNGDGWVSKEFRAIPKNRVEIPVQLYHLPLPNTEVAPSKEESKKEKIIKKSKKQEENMTVADFFSKDDDFQEINANKVESLNEKVQFLKELGGARKLLFNKPRKPSRGESQDVLDSTNLTTSGINETEVKSRRLGALEKLLNSYRMKAEL